MTNVDRREFTRLTLSALALSATPGLAWAAQGTESKVSAAAARLYKRAIVVDGCGGPGGFVPDNDGTIPLLSPG